MNFQKIALNELFEIKSTSSFNKDMLTDVRDEKFAYVTRTSLNNGILQYTGFVNESNINEANTFSLGLLQMNFFYQRTRWYAGQFVRKVIPKFEINDLLANYFGAVLNKQRDLLLSVLVREVDNTFNSIEIDVPVHGNGAIAFDYIEAYIKALEAERIKALETYLIQSGLNDYKLTDEESSAVSGFQNGGGITWSKFFLEDLFTIKNTTNIIKSEITDFSGQTPYIGASRECNGITAYINYNQQLLMQGNTLFIGGKTFTVFYQPNDYFSNDSHNIWLKLKTSVLDSKHTYQFMAACIYNALSDKYEWGNSISRAKIRNDSVYLPVLADGTPNYDAMAIYMRAVEKSVIKDVVDWKNVQLADLTNTHYA